MCIYGLIVFIETPKSRKQGRAFYVAISFLILVLYTAAELPSAYYVFKMVHKFPTPDELSKLDDDLSHSWWYVGNTWCSVILLWVADGLLVSISQSLRTTRLIG